MYSPLCVEYDNVSCVNCPCFFNCPFDEPSEVPSRSSKRAQRRFMSRLKNERMKKMIIDYNALAGYIDYDFDENDRYVPVGNHIKYRSRSGDRRFLKRQSSRLIRRTFEVPQRNQCQKVYDYWNHLY